MTHGEVRVFASSRSMARRVSLCAVRHGCGAGKQASLKWNCELGVCFQGWR